jgi:hypothetical protein
MTCSKKLIFDPIKNRLFEVQRCLKSEFTANLQIEIFNIEFTEAHRLRSRY